METLFEQEEQRLDRVDSLPDMDLASTSSGLTFLLSTEDSRSTTSSGDISTSSGENPPSVVEETLVPRLADPVPSSDEMALTARQNKCVGRNNRGVSWGFTSVIGRRKEMEDAVAIRPGFMSRMCDHLGGCTAPGSRTSTEISPVHFFGVYDGHGGSQVAKFCAERMHEVIAEEWGREAIDGSEWQRRWEVAFSSGFKRADNEVLTESVAPEMVGSTAAVVVLSGCQIITSNCGDSRAVLCRGTETIPLTVDQKPDRVDELMRIEGEGGKVINWNGARVFGVLAMSRAIGFLSSLILNSQIVSDFLNGTSNVLHHVVLNAQWLHSGDRYLRPWIIPVPEITFMTRTDEDECLILASDGLWDVMTNEEVGEVARRLLRRRRRTMMVDEVTPAQAVADNLTEIAYCRNSSDNISIIVVDLKSRRRRQQRQ
ncbi:hypothetical protein JRO89_XS04G0224800 [Xanthoceras sorbifolium]|uniref:protein-serine/threonine phosphatase n=1 Tax=Xanthoceras sorbifolium TaxID=99658 RepID=A0ABQ8I6I2_9ROSI|nr:hypothetical protein JRO89_XS04G0224800 [Xanthoceras sorbifolium]